MLVAGNMEGVGFSDLSQGIISWSLRPTVGVRISNQFSFFIAMMGGNICEDGLRKYCFEVGVFPIAGPVFEEISVAKSPTRLPL